MSSSRSVKRKILDPDAEISQPKRSKARSCEVCRRLKTRCEMKQDSIACHRCLILKQECSLRPKSENPGAVSSEPQELHGSVAVSDPCQSEGERLLALETTLVKVQRLLEKHLPEISKCSMPVMNAEKHMSRFQDHTPIHAQFPDHQYGRPLVADRNSRDAPMSLIRDMRHYILGAKKECHPDTSDDIVTKGIVSEELAYKLLTGFSQLSRRWLFMGPSPTEIRRASPLLFASCTLAGLHINRNLHGSTTHQALYNHISALLSKSMLISPLSLETIQSMLILSMWNLVPNKDTEQIDGWLLSGMAAMHGMLTLNFEQLVKSQKEMRIDPKSQEALRSWNLLCLCHLQFSVGTGRPPVISSQYLDQCGNILGLLSFDSRDQLVAAGVKLYSTLCALLNSDNVKTDNSALGEIDKWKTDCGLIFDLDSSKPLRFAYSCCYLILSRHTLKYLSQQPANQDMKDSDGTEAVSNRFIQVAIEHSHRLLTLFLSMSDLTAFVRPAYENLLCSFAMVTLSEFASYLEDANASLDLMEKTSYHVRLGGKAEPVSNWALDVLRKYVFDSDQASGQHHANADLELARADMLVRERVEHTAYRSQGYQFHTDGAVSQMFPSLEDMFLAN